ncbi:MAG: carboxypeptidase M32 [Aeromicrobium sp.]|nr:carboxypeptidase M32 [Burkholderiales bacterium]
MNAIAYNELSTTWKRLHHFSHLQALAGWDRMSMMPTSGNDARSNAMAEMDGLLHSIRTNPQLKSFLDSAEQETLNDSERANLREIRRDWRTANALPASLVQQQSMANAKCEHAWRTQRPPNDWPGFLANFREVLKCSREQATFLSNESGLKPYDALMDYYEPGMTSEKLDVLFGDLLTWLPDLVQKVRAKQAPQKIIAPTAPFSRAAQYAVGLEAMKLLGFDFNAGRLDESAHPFCGGVPEDTRLTTRYREDDFVGSLMGTIHETGHGRYEQNLPRNLLGQPVAWARSAGIHESQSLSFEMQIGLSRAFIGLLAPHIAKQFGAQPAFEPENLYQHLIRVQPSYIRVDADELTYPLHVILRYRIERDLIEGRIEADDIPALWDKAMAEFLDVDTRGNYTDGCMQDVHWGEGLFGYFPSYTLGAMYAAQWFAAIRRAVPDLDARLAAGDLASALDWLKTNVWEQGSRWTTDELVTRATGSTLDAAHYRRHLESRYLA